MKRLSVAIFTVVILLAALCGAGRASDLVTYQGKLTDAVGAPLPDGQYWLGARIWDTATGGTTPLWARKYQTPVTSGVFSVMLGATGTAWDSPPPLTSSLKLATAGGARWVEITVMSDANGVEKPSIDWTVLLPRQSLTSVPFAHNGVPTGTVVPFAGTTAPDGWTLCDGLPRDGTKAEFRALFLLIGLTYGGSGSSFNVPDLKGRTPIGAGQGNTLSNRTIAQKIGFETHTLTIDQMPAHSHTGQTNNDGAHKHTIDIEYWRSNSSNNYNHPGRSTAADGGWIRHETNVDGAHSHAFTTNATGGNNVPHNIMQPSIVLTYIIKL